MSKIDTIRLLDDHFPDLDALQDALREQGFEVPSVEAMRKWRPRKGFPAPMLAAVLVIVEKRSGRPVSLLPYLNSGDTSPCATAHSKAKSMPTGSGATIFD
jgi:hypothetical protein